MSSIRGVVVCFLAITLTYVSHAYPLHASCQATWTIGANCTSVKTAIVNQINAWKGADGCAKGGEKCLYSLTSSDGMEIKGKHETPVKHYTDDISFTLTAVGSTGCSVAGNSRSETWYAYLDYGTNFCNLRNLLDGAGLSKTTGFKEVSSDDVCTQYSSANCTVY